MKWIPALVLEALPLAHPSWLAGDGRCESESAVGQPEAR